MRAIAESCGGAGDAMDAMHFLNEAVSRYPAAISFAAGRPPSRFLKGRRVVDWMNTYVSYRAEREQIDPEHVWQQLAQYSDTAGVTRDLLAAYLTEQEGIAIPQTSLVVTNGFQEALLIALMALAPDARDTVLALEPTYVGLSGAAASLGLNVQALPDHADLGASVRTSVQSLRARGRRARALYVIPEFSNPTGECLDARQRAALLDAARECELVVLEDTAYRVFNYAPSPTLPTLKSKDAQGRVWLLGSFAKLLMPGLRFGYIAADSVSVERCVQLKSFVSVATSPFTQAAVGGYLLRRREFEAEHRERLAWCRSLRDHLLKCLEGAFGDARADVSWTAPDGGFFLLLRLPFLFGADELEVLARDYGVIATPLSMFYLDRRELPTVRLAFTNLDERQISEGVARLRRFVVERCSNAVRPSELRSS